MLIGAAAESRPDPFLTGVAMSVSAAARLGVEVPADDLSPIAAYLRDLHARLLEERSGTVATYIPELGRADPMHFGICVATVDGQIYAVGDAAVPFTIQSMSKPFTYGEALRRLGPEEILRHVGVEPTGESFNSIVLDDVHNRPFNPMVNAGAIGVAELMPGDTPAAREAGMLNLFSRLAGRPLTIDHAVYESERETGHRNRAIAYMMLNSGMIRQDPETVLDLYFRQCSVLVTATDMAVMAATLANRGTNPLTGDAVYEPEHVRHVLTLMNTCGMYNYAGQWAYDVGLPAKSGVSGGIIAVIPGEAGIAVYSPPLDRHGNSVRGIAVCREISDSFNLHAFGDRTVTRTVIRREYRDSDVGSKRVRSAAQRALLKAEGHRVAVVEVQGALYFGSTEVLIRRLSQHAQTAERLIVDFRRASHADPAAVRLIVQALRRFGERGIAVTAVSLSADGPLKALRAAMEGAEIAGLDFDTDTDHALERAEEALLARRAEPDDTAKYALHRIDLLQGLSREEYRLLEMAIGTFHFDAGQLIIREGDEANVLFIIVRGSASIFVTVEGGRRRRIGSVGPGYSVGEMALIEGGRRSADVVADEAVVCYGLSLERLREIAATHPNVMTTILANLVRSLSQRLRLANDEIRSLE
jgi:glutaminase